MEKEIETATQTFIYPMFLGHFFSKQTSTKVKTWCIGNSEYYDIRQFLRIRVTACWGPNGVPYRPGLTDLVSLMKYKKEIVVFSALCCSKFQADRLGAGRLFILCPLHVPFPNWSQSLGVEVGRYEQPQAFTFIDLG